MGVLPCPAVVRAKGFLTGDVNNRLRLEPEWERVRRLNRSSAEAAPEISPPQRHVTRNLMSARWSEELQRDVVRIAEGQA